MNNYSMNTEFHRSKNFYAYLPEVLQPVTSMISGRKIVTNYVCGSPLSFNKLYYKLSTGIDSSLAVETLKSSQFLPAR